MKSFQQKRQKKARSEGAGFWNNEYKKGEKGEKGERFPLSDKPSEDLLAFCSFLEREHGKNVLNNYQVALDIGCGNGRNALHLAERYGMKVAGFDISKEGVWAAERRAEDMGVRAVF